MKPWTILPLSILVAVPIGVLVRNALPNESTGAAVSDSGLVEASLDEISRSLGELANRHAALDARLDGAHPETARADATGVRMPSDDEIAAAVQRWQEANGDGSATADSAAAVERTPGEDEIEGMDMEAVVQLFLSDGARLEAEALFQKLREAGRIDEFVEWIEKLAAENPDDPDLQVARGVSYLQKLFDLGRSPEVGLWATKADQAFDTALELDPANWDARFTKAVALSNWPAFLGRTGEAISQFEVLLEQQKSSPTTPQHAQTYLFLGNMYVQTGEKEKAVAVWRDGLALFPNDEDLRRQLELAR